MSDTIPERHPTPESKEIKRNRNGFRVITDNPTVWVISCIAGGKEWRQTLRKTAYTFRDVCQWLYDYGGVLTMSALTDRKSEIGASMQTLHGDTDTRALCGEIALHVLRKAVALGDSIVTVDDVQRAACPLITRRAVKEALQVGVDRGIYLQVDEESFALDNESVLTERIERGDV